MSPQVIDFIWWSRAAMDVFVAITIVCWVLDHALYRAGETCPKPLSDLGVVCRTGVNVVMVAFWLTNGRAYVTGLMVPQ